jgi:hypothetical protein
MSQLGQGLALRSHYDSLDQVAEDLQVLVRFLQKRSHSVLAAAPRADQLLEGEVVLMDDGANRRIYTKLKGVIRYAALT